jgi:hypothetical protein
MVPKIHLQYPYPGSVDFVKFSDFESSDLFQGYAYDYSLSDLKDCLELLKIPEKFKLIYETMRKDWQDTEEVMCQFENPHTLRVAMLMKIIPVEGMFPVQIDTFSRSFSYLEGHHRLLALKELGCKVFPASLSESCDIIDSQLLKNCN